MIIGIDGGGTKTTGIAVDDYGKVLGLATVGPTNPNSADELAIKKELSTLFAELLSTSKLGKEDIVFAGISGAESGGKKEWFQQILEELLGNAPKIMIDNDAITALYSETKGEAGIVCISGTGSIAFGINEELKRARVGGWGYLINDGYSGFTVGKRLLEYVFTSFDEGKDSCELSDEVLAHFQVGSVTELIPVVYELGKTRDRVASVARIVVDKANTGDKVCTSIMENAAEVLLKDIKLLFHRLTDSKKEMVSQFPIVLTGGIIKHSSVLISYLQQKLQKKACRSSLA